ncbi:DUF1064 domain-containing protein [Brevibacillus agri]|uniref:DUF1064 domain-containing protein n=1 Tax=Brevibacillus agri TaxID=51101 RepID=UPI0025B684F0|nr:DUF1064 domain-containing protein [Brevibacillus agri]MDN4094367.1 DUF1064 domain-containing protein [Brevibacillus agri]
MRTNQQELTIQVHRMAAPASAKKSKYRAKKIEIDGIIFDSKVEGEYYLHLKEQKEKGIIKDFELQPRFLLIDGYTNSRGEKVRPTFYVADFKIYEPDGSCYVVDIKGMATEAAKLKKKMFESRYIDVPLLWIVKVKSRGGWIEYQENERLKKVAKKMKGEDAK